MKHSLKFLLICAFLNCSMVDFTWGFSRELSKFTDKGCKYLTFFRKLFHIKHPSIESVSFILRTPCTNKEIGVTEARQLRYVPGFDPNKNTVFFVTGWRARPNAYYVDAMAKAHHCRNDTNFVVVNTGESLRKLYTHSAYHANKLGEYIAKGLSNSGIPAEKIQLIGHSLGAHIVGSAGRHFRYLTDTNIERITGLDPANPCFMKHPVFRPLDRNDAKFVDIIHTNPNELGIKTQIGHVDFYPDGYNVHKKGCKESASVCSHIRAVHYYAESVYPGNENNFKATQCTKPNNMNTCAGATSFMGYVTDMNAKGPYYVAVRSKAPYGKNASRSATTSSSSKCGLCPK